MTDTIERLRSRLHDAREALEAEIDARRARFRYRLRGRRVEFGPEVREAHRAARESLRSFLARTRLLVVLSAPFIYALILPLVLLDIFVSLYQAVCFPVYGIAKVARHDHIAIDRHHLAYLNGLQKLNCVYCGYANGVLSLAREVASRTEAYWCPIKHARRVADPHDRMPGFADYGDAEGFRQETAPEGQARAGPATPSDGS
ncbi:hypothetical protein N8I71_10840 [Roseibacterium sp. SDUM158016]|uniref:hypothetical protein n=1 Tax=Roseicyclus sediminis TaxID=2980997 RepID=UPI0021CE7F56|nr:hypothetical protein [Roseibacterium sp. SDUM158016]MCU4653332.1 hypothetical protein [Roseibacterium sp. SDUM158016]